MRLTHGGEPTFVSIDDMDAPEWNTDALGTHKRERAEVLVRRLKQRLAPGALLHTGQGKWYPGEPLPRWALGIYWRRDGVPVWKDDALLAEAGRDYGHGIADAERFAATLAQHLGLAPRYAQPAYEDALAALQQEAELPPNLDPARADLDDPALRGDLANKLSRGLDTPSAMCCRWPGARTNNAGTARPGNSAATGSISGPGRFADGAAPAAGLAALGGRGRREPWVEVDPFAAQLPLADYHGEVAARYSSHVDPQPAHPEVHPQTSTAKDAVEVPHTALCVEARSRRPVRIHAARRHAGAVSRPAGRGRSHRCPIELAGDDRRLPAARRQPHRKARWSPPTPASSRSTSTRRTTGSNWSTPPR